MRRGDDDDNRTSPHGRGLRGIVLSTALEFNPLKASIGFLALIIGPALLVGIAPSIVVTYGRLMFHKATLAESYPIVALVSLAVLVGVALWIGRPLLASAVDHFWHLHYTLVVPILVALRELIRVGAERFPGRAITSEQLNRRRRLGTVLAALLLAGGGLALAMTVEVSIGLQLVDVEHVQPWAVARAALGNAAVILGLSTVVESLYWLWRELTINGPALDWVPDPSKAESSVARVAHLSDLHALTPLDRVLLTGDITDAGTRAEWAEFIDLLRSYPELRARLSFVPGNHDMNIVDRTNPGILDLPWSTGQSLRKLRVVLALDAVQGDRAHVVDHASGALGPSLKDYLREGGRAEMLRALAQRGALRGRWEMAKIWDAIFPLVELAPADDGYGLILLNSNAPSHFLLTNAIGIVNRSQLSALKSILRNSPGRAWMILLHHQVVEYPVASISLRYRIGLALVNAPDVLAAIAPYASRVLILHGHRHTDWIGTCGNVVLCSAPSVSLGSSHGEEKYRGSFHVHKIASGADGGIRLITTERVKVA